MTMIELEPNSINGSAPSPHPTETLFHSEPWRHAVETAFGVRIDRFVPTADPFGVAYYALIEDLRGQRVVSTPFSDFCDPLFGPEGWGEFANHLRSFGYPVTVRPFANEAAINDSTFEQRQELLWHGIDLSEGHDKVWSSLSSNSRTKIRRAAKLGITFRASSSVADLATFHRMHVALRKSKYGLLAQPFGFFTTLYEGFGDDLMVLTAECDGEAVASMVFLAWNGVWYYKFGASVERAYRPNAALINEACRLGAERGMTLLDMGRSDIDQPGLVAFKRTFAPGERALTTLHWRPEGYHNPQGDSAGAVLGQVTKLLTAADVPDATTTRAGDLLYRYFA